MSNNRYIVHTVWNITDSIVCLVFWAGVGKSTVVKVAMIYLVETGMLDK